VEAKFVRGKGPAFGQRIRVHISTPVLIGGFAPGALGYEIEPEHFVTTFRRSRNHYHQMKLRSMDSGTGRVILLGKKLHCRTVMETVDYSPDFNLMPALARVELNGVGETYQRWEKD